MGDMSSGIAWGNGQYINSDNDQCQVFETDSTEKKKLYPVIRLTISVAATMANTEADAPTNVAPATCELNKGNTL